MTEWLSYIVARPYVTAVVLLALGTWLMLPPGHRKRRAVGGMLNLIGVSFLIAQLTPAGSHGQAAVFWMLAAVTLVSAVSTITARNPVYCALWFGMTLLGTAGLFLVQGAQFLAVATVVVYAGAILVTFLFVLMLATPTGTARCDRLTIEPLLSAATGAVLVGVLSMAVAGSLPAAPPSGAALETHVLSQQHVASLGGELFGGNLVAVELAGTLLMVALVGAVAIVARGKELEQEQH